MRRFISILALLGLVATGLVAVSQAAQPPAKIRVLLITGDDVPVHPWRATTDSVRKTLEATGKFDVKVAEDPLILESQRARRPTTSSFSTFMPAACPTRPSRSNRISWTSSGAARASTYSTWRAPRSPSGTTR